MNCGPTALYTNDAAPGHCEAPQCPPGLVLIQRKAARGLNGAPPTNGLLPPGNGGCPAGQTRINDVCQPSGGGQNMCVNYCGCPEGTPIVNGVCCTREAMAGGRCCPEGTRYIGDGVCQPVSGCPEGTPIVNGVCCTREAYAAGRCCPEGTRYIGDGVCQPTNGSRPLCLGPNCPTVIIDPRPPGGGTNACPDGRPRNSDGNCPPPQACTGKDKAFIDEACRCKFGMKENKKGDCVRAPTAQSKRSKRTNTSQPTSDTPQSSPGISIGIGVGIGGGGPRGGRPPGGGGRPSGGDGARTLGR